MAYPRENFIPSVFIDVPDPSNPPVGALEVDADEMNKLGQQIQKLTDGLHQSKYILNTDEFKAYDSVDSFPISSESSMVVTHASWPEVGGVVKTYRDRASIVSSDLISYDYQEFKAKNSHHKYLRFALMSTQATWLPNHTYVSGQIVQPVTENGHYYKVTTGGLSKATEPIWPTTTDGEVTEADSGGANPTVTWVEEGTFWSDWYRILTTQDTAAVIGGLLASNPTFTGTLTGPDIVITGNFINTPPTTQVISAAGNAITANGRKKKVSNTTGGSITLTSVPTIANGSAGQEIFITNIGTQNIVLQDQGTLAGSNLRLTATTVTLTPLDTIHLTYFTEVGDWVQTGNTVAVV